MQVFFTYFRLSFTTKNTILMDFSSLHAYGCYQINYVIVTTWKVKKVNSSPFCLFECEWLSKSFFPPVLFDLPSLSNNNQKILLKHIFRPKPTLKFFQHHFHWRNEWKYNRKRHVKQNLAELHTVELLENVGKNSPKGFVPFRSFKTNFSSIFMKLMRQVRKPSIWTN